MNRTCKLISLLRVIWLGLTLLALTTNCAGTSFSGSPSASESNGPIYQTCEGHCLADHPDSQFANIDVSRTLAQPGTSCATSLLTTALNPKVLFAVDRSSSNVHHNGIGTDPGKVYRGTALNDFFNRYRSNANFSWGLNAFDVSSFAILNNGSKSSPKISNSQSEMNDAISSFLNTPDGSGTNYKAAIQMLSTQLKSDSADPLARYILVFISDGLPNTGYQAKDDQLTLSGMDEMLTDIRNLTTSSAEKITFNTIYYGQNDPAASALMQKMAAVGKGRFLDVNKQGRSFPIADLVQFPGLECHDN